MQARETYAQFVAALAMPLLLFNLAYDFFFFTHHIYIAIKVKNQHVNEREKPKCNRNVNEKTRKEKYTDKAKMTG